MKIPVTVSTWHHGRGSKCVMQVELRKIIHIFKFITSRGTRMNKGLQRFNEKNFAKKFLHHIAQIFSRKSSCVIS